jgi:hypothetical protein
MRGRARLRPHRFDFFLCPARCWPGLFLSTEWVSTELVCRRRLRIARRDPRTGSPLDEFEECRGGDLNIEFPSKNRPDLSVAPSGPAQPKDEFAVHFQPGSAARQILQYFFQIAIHYRLPKTPAKLRHFDTEQKQNVDRM